MARNDFLSINTAIQSLDVLEQKEFNIALAYDLDFKMPNVIFNNKKPELEEVEGDTIFVMSYFNGTEWDYSCIVFMRENLMAGDCGVIMPQPMLTTVYSCNFNKLPCAHQIKRFGDWLNSINAKERRYYGFEFTMNRDGIYYKHIEHDCNKPRYKTVKKCLSMIAHGGKLNKGFVAGITVLSEDFQVADIVTDVQMKIKPAFKNCLENIRNVYPKTYMYRVDGGNKEAQLQSKLQYYAMKVKENATKAVAV